MEQFCIKCGTQLVDGVCPNCSGEQSAPQTRQPVSDDRQNEKFKKVFMNPKEKFVCALGNNYAQNFLAGGSLGKGFAIVSDKRVYFKGKTYEISGKKFKVKNTASTVDLKDITGTEVRTLSQVAPLALGFIFLILGSLAFVLIPNAKNYNMMCGFIGVLIGIIFLIVYLASKRIVLTIMFGGGGIAVPLNWYSAREGEDFQRMLRISKDNAVEEAENAAANAMREVMANTAPQPQAAVSAADELAKYAQLYKDGLISEEEFADIKAKIFAKQ